MNPLPRNGTTMLIIDCHAHIYSSDEKKYPPKEKPLRVPNNKPSAIEDLLQTADLHGVDAVRAVQTVSFYNYDNRYVCDATKANSKGVAGVCTLNPDNPESPSLLRHFVREFGISTLRSTPGDNRRTFDHPGVRNLWRACAETGATVDIFLMRPEWVPGAEKLFREFPDLTIGFDHCMDLKPGPLYDRTLAEVLRLEQYPNLYPKLDFISTGTQIGYPGTDLHDATLKIIAAYGADRCVWGSNYPNALWTPMLTYAEHLHIFTHVLPLDQKTRNQILGETARRLWFPSL